MLAYIFFCCLGMASVVPLKAMSIKPYEPNELPSVETDDQSALSADLPSDNRISGGMSTNLNQIPWQAFVLYSGSYCGGTVITSNYILTAGHCCSTSTGAVQASSSYQVKLGTSSVSTGGLPAGGSTFYVSQVIRHPNYTRSAVTQYLSNDFCLLKLSTAATFSVAIQQIALPVKTSWCTPDTVTLVATGWGQTSSSTSGVSSTLNMVPLLIEPCSSFGLADRPNILCTGTAYGVTSGKGTCQGDSGGPLFGVTNTRPVICGVGSQVGVTCGAQNNPSVFGSVYAVFSWITQTVGSGYVTA